MRNPINAIKEYYAVKRFTKDAETLYDKLRENGISTDMHWKEFESKGLGQRSRDMRQMFEPMNSNEFARRHGDSDADQNNKPYFISRMDVLGAADCKGYSPYQNQLKIKDPVDLAKAILGILAESDYEFGVSAVEHFENKISWRGGSIGYRPGGKHTMEEFEEKYRAVHDGTELPRTDFVVLTGNKKYLGVNHVVDIGIMPFRSMYSDDINEEMDVHNFDHWNNAWDRRGYIDGMSKLSVALTAFSEKLKDELYLKN